ncbi:MAG: hypothetical protein H6741_08700 [Alphaproteobacteria bacterium]|nr:hypothetical protein [Alphaproteobacteria bacterium]
MNKVLTASLLLMAATGCAKFVDSDGDGLTNAEEAELGTDPELADTDGDGLSDLDEDLGGSDPLVVDTDGDGLTDYEESLAGTLATNPDSDGDGYLDGWEVAEGSDPANAGSLIYQCGWPYNPDKDSIESTTMDNPGTALGEKFARVQVMDRCGDTFDLYDVAGQGVPVAIDVSAIWCGPCNGIASWISGEGDPYGFGGTYPGVPEAIEEGKVIWVTVLGENSRGSWPSQTSLEAWYRSYPEEHSPLLADDADNAMKETYILEGWPSVWLVDEDMSILHVPRGSNYYGALTMIGEL